jgi:hypothetical protein
MVVDGFPLVSLALSLAMVSLAPKHATAQEQSWFGAQLEGLALDGTLLELAGTGAGVHLVRVVSGGPCHRSGFATGDILLALDGAPFGDADAAALEGFMERLGDSQPGDRMALDILRQTVTYEGTRDGVDEDNAVDAARRFIEIMDGLPPGSSLQVRATKRWELLHLTATLGQRPSTSGRPLPPTADLFPGIRLRASPLAGIAEQELEESGLTDDYHDLLARLVRLAERGDFSRVNTMVLIHRRPFALPSLAEHLVSGFETPRLKRRVGAGLLRILEHASAIDGHKIPADDQRDLLPPPTPGLAPETLLDLLEEHLKRVTELRDRGLAALSPEDLDHVGMHWQDVLDQFENDIYLYNDEDTGRAARNEATLRIGEKVDRNAMLRATAAALPLVTGDWLTSLREDLEAAGLDTSVPIVLQRDTPYGRIRIAGTGDDVHRQGNQGTDSLRAELDALLIDLGGDDVHTAGGSTTNAAGRPVLSVGILIDLEGNDAYESTQDAGQGAGVLGVGILRDLEGDDLYTTSRWGQGAGWMGVGLLLDDAGDDRFRAQTMAQGLGAWGLGLLIDVAGDDSYRALRYGQAVGLAGGIGVLSDRGGDDRYYCKGRWPTGYGTPGVFEGWGQGCGIGFRGNASGGVGLLIDGAGTDNYEAGNFAQGGGYYFGFGALVDRGRSSDRYIGSRYNQGFSAHQAAGFFLEEGGDDTYETRNAVAHGLAWDESVSFFIDRGGNDHYRGGGFSLGASAHNSICVFHDRAGEDTYLRGGFGQAGGNDYHGGTSLSLFLDTGGAQDAYPGENLNERSVTQPEHSVFVDR